MTKIIILLIVHCSLLFIISPYEILDGIPVVFQIDGNVSYVPTSGVSTIPGYKLKIGYSKHKWIGIKFMEQTSNSQYDILVMERAANPVSGYYETTIGDYFVSEGRPDKLISDSVNNMDKQVTSNSESNYFYLQISRTKGNTQGEDWAKSQFVEICFLTSEKDFNQEQWSDLIESCYGYSISQNYVSTFKGRKIGQMNFDEVNSIVYGGIQGPILTMQLFWYCLKPVLSSNDVIIRIGEQIDPEIVGYDFHVCGSGDYFGLNSSSITPDSSWSGYNDGTCEKISSALSTKLSYQRKVYTHDQFDGTIYNQTQICVQVGSVNECQVLALQNLYPIMTVNSSINIFENRLKLAQYLVAMFLIFITV